MVDMYRRVACLNEHLIEKPIQLMSKEQRNAKKALSSTPKSPKHFLFLTPLFLSLSISLDTKPLTHDPFMGH